MKNKDIDITIIVPIFNGADHIESFYLRLSSVVKKIARIYELIFADDGSTDNTLEKLIQIKQDDDCLKIISLSSNCGQHYALSKGVEKAQGKAVILIDDDQEYALEYIPIFLQELKKGYDLVLGWRCKRNIYFLRKIGTWIINLLISIIIRKRIHDFGGPKAFGNKGASVLYRFRSILKTINHLKHLRIYEIKINDSSTSSSRYNFKKLLQLFFQILTTLLGYDPLQKYKKINAKDI